MILVLLVMALMVLDLGQSLMVMLVTGTLFLILHARMVVIIVIWMKIILIGQLMENLQVMTGFGEEGWV